MASDPDLVQFIADQMSSAGEISYKKMFGEYGIYCDGIIFGLICDNQLFIKPTEAGKKYINNVIEKPPYPGAKNYYFIEDKFEDREWISELVRTTIKELQEKNRKVKKPTNKKKT